MLRFAPKSDLPKREPSPAVKRVEAREREKLSTLGPIDKLVLGITPSGKGQGDVVKVKPPKVGRPSSGRQLITLRLDPEVIAKFKASGKGWQSRINEALRKAVV